MIIDIVLLALEGRGGLEDVLTRVTNELCNRKHQPRIFLMQHATYRQWEDTIPEIYCFNDLSENKRNEITFIDLANNYYTYLEKLGYPDIVIATHSPLSAYLSYLTLHNNIHNKNIPIISWLHGPVGFYGNEKLLTLCDAHLAISKNIATEIRGVCATSPIYYIGNPLPVLNQAIITRPSNKYKLIYIGRLQKDQKRLDVLLTALANAYTNWELTIIGSGPDEDYFKNLANEIKLDNKVTWMGWKEEPWKEIQEASLLLQTSDFEGFSLVLIEALSRGLPVIASQCDGAVDLVIDHKNGWLFPRGDSEALTKLINNILDNTYSLPLAEQCIDSVKQWDTVPVIDLIEKILTIESYKSNIANNIML